MESFIKALRLGIAAEQELHEHLTRLVIQWGGEYTVTWPNYDNFSVVIQKTKFTHASLSL
jgi:hypothetical protein